MGQQQAGSYDLFVSITQSGLERAIRAAFLEQWPLDGLPVPFSMQAEDNVRQFVLFLGLPSVIINPSRDTGSNVEGWQNAIGIELPFEDSAQIFMNNPDDSIFGLNGTFTLILTLIDNEDRLNIDTTLTQVWLNGIDPNKIPPGAVQMLEWLISEQFRSSPPELLIALIENTGIGMLFGVPTCPDQPTDQDFGTAPTLQAPTALAGIDPEVHGAGAPGGLLLLKSKLTERALAAGTANDPAQGNTAWVAAQDEIGLLISNRFLLEELLPPALMPVLLEEQINTMVELVRADVPEDEVFLNAVRAEIAAEVDGDHTFTQFVLGQITGNVNNDDSIALEDKAAEIETRFQQVIADRRAEETERRFLERIERMVHDEIHRRIAAQRDQIIESFFAFPLQLNMPIPRTFSLPSVWDILSNPANPQASQDPSAPNCLLYRVSLSLQPGGGGPSVIHLNLGLSGGAEGYTFDADINIALAFSHIGGELRIVPSIPDPQVDVQIPLWVYAAGIAIGALSGAIIFSVVGAVIGGLVVALADAAIDAAAGRQVQGVLGDNLGALDDVDLGEMLGFTSVRRALLDDLTVAGAFRIGHNFEGATRAPAGVVVEQLSIAAENEQIFVPGQPDLAMSILAGTEPCIEIDPIANQVRPLAGASLFDFGSLLPHSVDNIGQGDLRVQAGYTSQPVALGGGVIDPLVQLPRAIGIRLQTSAMIYPCYALLVIERDVIGRLHVFVRSYRQTQPGLDLLVNQLGLGHLQPITCRQTGGVTENIDVPVLVGPGSASLGSIAVGTHSFACSHEILVSAVTRRLRPPVSAIQWIVILTDGSQHSIPPGSALNLDVDPSSGQSSQVSFTLQDGGSVCRINTEEGKDGQFHIRARVTEKENIQYEAEVPIQFKGTRINVFGFDRWLETFERTLAALAGVIDDGRDPRPLPIDLFGDPGHETYPGRHTGLLDRGREILLFRDGISVRDAILADPTGERGLNPDHLARVWIEDGRRSPARPFNGRAAPAALSGLDARKELTSRVMAGLNNLHKRYGDSKLLAESNRRLVRFLERLPDPHDLLARIEKDDHARGDPKK